MILCTPRKKISLIRFRKKEKKNFLFRKFLWISYFFWLAFESKEHYSIWIYLNLILSQVYQIWLVTNGNQKRIFFRQNLVKFVEIYCYFFVAVFTTLCLKLLKYSLPLFAWFFRCKYGNFVPQIELKLWCAQHISSQLANYIPYLLIIWKKLNQKNYALEHQDRRDNFLFSRFKRRKAVVLGWKILFTRKRVTMKGLKIRLIYWSCLCLLIYYFRNLVRKKISHFCCVVLCIVLSVIREHVLYHFFSENIMFW